MCVQYLEVIAAPEVVHILCGRVHREPVGVYIGISITHEYLMVNCYKLYLPVFSISYILSLCTRGSNKALL